MYSTFGRLLYYGTALEKAAFSPVFVWTQWLETDTSSLYAWDGSSWLTISVPTGLSGSGTPGIISQWTGANSLGDSTLKKTGAGLLELVSAGAYTLTIPTSGTAALGAGTVTSSSSNDASVANHTHALDNVGPGATGPIGSATVVPIVTIDAKGRVTGLTSTTIAGVAPFAHDILSAYHGDTLADAVVRGDLIVGNATPKWARLAKGTANAVLQPTATDVAWSSGFLSIASGKTLTVNNTITLAATADGYTLTIPGTGTALLEATAATTYLKLDASNDPVTGDLDINAALTVGVTTTSPNLGVTGRVVIDADSNATVTPALDIHMHPYGSGVGQWMGIFSKVTTVAGQPIGQTGALYTALYHNAGFTLADWRGIETGGAYVWAGSSITMASGLYAALPNAWEFGGSIDTAAAIWMPGSNTTGIGTYWSILQTGAAPSYWNGTFNMEDNSLPIDAWRTGGATQMRFTDYADSATAGPRILLRHARDVYASPDQVFAGDQAGLIIFDQYINGDFRQGAYIGTLAGTTISGTSYPMIMDFRVVPEGSTVNTRHMTIANRLVSIFNDLTVQHTTSFTTLKLSSGDSSVSATDYLAKIDVESNDANLSAGFKIGARIGFISQPGIGASQGAVTDIALFTTAVTANALPQEWMRLKSTGAVDFLNTSFVPTTTEFVVGKAIADFFDPATLGSELITSGDFSSSVGWSLANATLDVSTGQGVVTQTASTAGTIRQSITTVPNTLYKVVFDYVGTLTTNCTGVGVRFGTGVGLTNLGVHTMPVDELAQDKTYTLYFIATTTTSWFQVNFAGSTVPGPGSVGVLDNVSIKAVAGGNVISRGIFSGGGTAGIKVDTLGNVGIGGQTSPTAALHFGGTGGTAAEGIEFGTDAYLYRVSAGVLRSYASQLQVYPISANTTGIFRVIPSGSPAATRSTIQIFNTDFIADGANYEAGGMRFASNNFFDINSSNVGTGTLRPIQFSMNSSQIGVWNTNGGLQILGIADRIQLLVKANAPQSAANLVEMQPSASSTPFFFISGTGTTKTTGRKQAVVVKSANYTLTVNDEVVVVTATCTMTLPVATGSGQTYRICNEGAAGVVVTIDGNGTDTIKSELTQFLNPGEDLILTDYAVGKFA